MERPFRGFVDFVQELGRASGRMYDVYHRPGSQGTDRAEAWVPTTDVLVRGNDLVIRAELPGVRREGIDVTHSGGVLTISGVREGVPDEDVAGYYVRERVHGAFRRSMSLPEGVGEKDLEASFEDGVLEIVVRGVGDAVQEPKRIRVGGPSE